MVAMSEALLALATGALESAVLDVAASFRRETGDDIAFGIGNAGEVARRTQSGERVCLVMSSSAGIDALAANGLLDPATKTDIGDMRLGFAIKAGGPVPDLKTVAAVRAAFVANPAVAFIDPAGGGSAGAHTMTWLNALGVAEAVLVRGTKCATGRAIVNAVVGGAAAIGVTQGSEIIGVTGVAFAGFLPDELQLVTRYCAALPTSRHGEIPAKAFLAYLKGPVGAGRLRQSGWQVAAPDR
jgi:molybdate transport system substrate-binding protein